MKNRFHLCENYWQINKAIPASIALLLAGICFLLLQHIPQNRLQDAAIFIVLHFYRCVDPHNRFEGLFIATVAFRHNIHFLLRLQIVRQRNGKLFLAGQAERLGRPRGGPAQLVGRDRIQRRGRQTGRPGPAGQIDDARRSGPGRRSGRIGLRAWC